MKHRFIGSTDRSKMFYWQGDRPFTEAETKKVFLDRHQNFNLDLAKQAIEYGMIQAGKNKNKVRVKKLHNIIPFGSVNVVMKATLIDNTEVIFRGHPPEVKNGYFWAESVAAQKARKAGVPAYKTYLIDDTRRKFDFDYMLTECLPGKNMKSMWPIPKKLDKKLIEQTGYYLAKIHSIKPKKFGFFDNQIAKKQKKLVGIHQDWKDHIYAAFKKNLNYLVKTKVVSLAQKSKIEEIFSKNKKLLELKEAVIVQNDIADWNQLVKGDKITAILDWDECHSGDPVAEFAAWSLFFPSERMQPLIRGYEKITPLPNNFEAKFHLYRLRYLVAKIVLRKKKLMFKKSKFMQDLLNHGLKTLQEEFEWYSL